MGQSATSANRSVYLDALRAFALTRVVLYHSTNLWTVTAFTAMPLMFFIAGSLYANSIERRPIRQVVIDRYRRILFPYWLYVAAMIVLWGALGVLGEVNPLSWISFAMPVLSFGGPQGPGEPGSALEFTWIALWYLQMHLILSLAGGWMRRMQLAHGKRYWIALGALTVLLLPIGVGALFFWALCWSLGYLQHDGVLETWISTRWKWIALATGPIGFALFFAFHESPALQPVAGVGALLLGGFWLAVALGLRSAIEPRLEGGGVRAVVNWVSARALTIYLWHMVAVYAVVELPVPGNSSPLGRFAWVCAAMVPAAVLFGWAEDLAARRPPRLWPRAPGVRPAPADGIADGRPATRPHPAAGS
jgi:fucose 4-O-acetylase-like acetyltransferase